MACGYFAVYIKVKNKLPLTPKQTNKMITAHKSILYQPVSCTGHTIYQECSATHLARRQQPANDGPPWYYI